MQPQPLPDPTAYQCPFSDHIYTTKHGVELRLRLWPAPTQEPSPWVLWSHGGGFLFGLHEEVTPWVVPALLRRGIHIVSYAYRYAPEASMADIVGDAEDAYAWCRNHLVTFLGRAVLLDSYAVAGDSAGGTIAALLAQRLEPPPRALLANHAVLDLADPYFDTFHEYGPLSGEFSEKEVAAAAENTDPSNAIMTCPGPARIAFGEDALRKAFHSLTLVVGRRQRLQADVKTLFMRGNWVDAVLRGDTPEARKAYAAQWSPLRLCGARGGGDAPSVDPGGTTTDGADGDGVNGSGVRTNGAAVPMPAARNTPTFFIHGEADNIIPVAQSRDYEAHLRAAGVDTGAYYDPDGGHVFDQRFISPRVEGYDACCTPCVDFIERHLRD